MKKKFYTARSVTAGFPKDTFFLFFLPKYGKFKVSLSSITLQLSLASFVFLETEFSFSAKPLHLEES